MIEYVVLRQIESGPCADSWDVIFVNVSAESPEDAIRDACTTHDYKGGEGRYVAIPNEYWVGENVKIKRIAEVTLEKEDLI